jgi:hypothetical protein
MRFQLPETAPSRKEVVAEHHQQGASHLCREVVLIANNQTQSSMFNSENPCGSAGDRNRELSIEYLVLVIQSFHQPPRAARSAILRQKHLEFSGQSGMMGR